MRRRRLTRREKRSRRKKAIIVSTLCLLFVMTAGYAAFQTNLSITAKGNIKEPSRVIQSWGQYSNEDFHTDYYRENIVSATFLNTNQVASNATESWDVSEDGKGGVKAWVVPNTENSTKYDLYIGANGGVIANEDSSYLFYKFIGVKAIKFGENFNTNNVTNMAAMFMDCSNLIDLNLVKFNTSNVTNMEFMFSACSSMQIIDLSSFDTSSVILMNSMFDTYSNIKDEYVETSLTQIIFGENFKVNKVTNMSLMFHKQSNLRSLNLCFFDTNSAIYMRKMFQETFSLETIYVGSNWATEQADTTDMFLYSNISSVTTGQC